MRIWTIHPQYLDTKGLLALWRETLLAQKVLRGETAGYRNHPQLQRFRMQRDPAGAVGKYLQLVYEEATGRGYNFNREKIETIDSGSRIECGRGQLLYEWNHLKEKLRARDARRYLDIKEIAEPQAHPLFVIVAGGVEAWEIVGAGSL
ncbi:MAG TPA: pyrimidine dimer DNA glycosylase/endonuclease V [Pyrinomonadaceae bacterium]|jgi:hypothetical protein